MTPTAASRVKAVPVAQNPPTTPRNANGSERKTIADAHQDRLDGLTVDLGDWWFNLRPSNTEPLLRLNLEAATVAECERCVAELRTLIAKGS